MNLYSDFTYEGPAPNFKALTDVASKDALRPAMMFIYVERAGTDGALFVATDGHRLIAEDGRKMDPAGAMELSKEASDVRTLIPVGQHINDDSVYRALRKIRNGAHMTMRATYNPASHAISGSIVCGNLIIKWDTNGDMVQVYPDWRAVVFGVLNERETIRIEVRRNEVRESANDQKRWIHSIKIAPEMWVNVPDSEALAPTTAFYVTGSTFGTWPEHTAADRKAHGERIEKPLRDVFAGSSKGEKRVGFNLQYVDDACRHAGVPEIELRMHAPNRAARMANVPFIYLLMPIMPPKN